MEWYNIAQKGQVRDTDKNTVSSTAYNQCQTALHGTKVKLGKTTHAHRHTPSKLIHDL